MSRWHRKRSVSTGRPGPAAVPGSIRGPIGGSVTAPTSTNPVAVLALAMTAALVLLATTLAPAAALVRTSDIVDDLNDDGRYLEVSADASSTAAIDRANDRGVAVAWLDGGDSRGGPADLADDYFLGLDELGSRYHTVLVILDDSFAASSTRSQVDLDRALDAAERPFDVDDVGGGIDAFADNLASGTASDGDGGISFGSILLLLAVAGGGFLLIRSWLARRRAKRQAEVESAADRAEIEEQLKANADRVISLGDRVIISERRELIDLYEQASTTYQEVSREVETATTATEIDALDDRIDHAEWQFDVIEAELDGRPRPAQPVPEEDAPDGPAGRPAPIPTPGTDDRDGQPRSEPPVATSPRTGRSYPRGRPGRRGGLGGGLGGMLGGVLGNIVLGGGLGGLGGPSRRTQRRTTDPTRRSGSSRTSGGPVLRGPGGGSTSRTRSRRSSGSRSRSRSRSRGSRRR